MTTGACPYHDVPNTADRGAARKADAIRRADDLLKLVGLPTYTEIAKAAKQTPMVYDPTPRKSILTDEAVEAGQEIAEEWQLIFMEGHAASTLTAIFHAMEAHLPNFVLNEQKIIAAFPERTGQYVTNDASRDAAIAEAVASTPAAQAQEPAELPRPDDIPSRPRAFGASYSPGDNPTS